MSHSRWSAHFSRSRSSRAARASTGKAEMTSSPGIAESTAKTLKEALKYPVSCSLATSEVRITTRLT